jgi:hypothetical protein
MVCGSNSRLNSEETPDSFIGDSQVSAEIVALTPPRIRLCLYQSNVSEFQPKMKRAIAENSSNPEETREMIRKIEDLVLDLEWR